MNPYDARIERVYARLTGIDVPDETPNVDPPNAPTTTFEVVVEAIAGSIQKGSGSPYQLTGVLEDVTVTTLANVAFNISAPGGESFLTTLATVAAPGPGLLQSWPAYKRVFQIALTPAIYTPGHTYQYHVTLVSQGFYVVSAADSQPFVLF